HFRDGKHVRWTNPENSDSLFYNYKKYFSIVLKVADANLNFIYIDVGAYGREVDFSVFHQCVWKNPYVFVVDEAFGLQENLLRPFLGRELNNTRRVL
ncbi:protein ALP1-like, partial [Aphis craccivora]